MVNLFNLGNLYRVRKVIHVPTSSGKTLRVRLGDLPHTQLRADGEGIVMRIRTANEESSSAEWLTKGHEVDLTGDEALRAAAALLPRFNYAGGSRDEVSRAVSYLEESSDPKRLFRRAVDAIQTREDERGFFKMGTDLLKHLPTAGRLALEMATHEDSERRALEGELHILEAAWREAEEIAGIADDMFLPESVADDLARLKRQRDGE
jgi:hypothetical protein